MGTDVEFLLDASPGTNSKHALDRTEAKLEHLEHVMSRFRNDSELSALNRAGRLEGASADLVRVVELALAAREESGGLFDPTVHGAVVAAGYDRDFEFVPADGDALPGSGVAPTETRCAGRVLVNGDSIALAAGVKLDLGGIGKGYAADRAAEVLAVAGPCLVNVGGDIAVRGGSWPIGVTPEITLELTGGGMATSGRDRRRWRRGGDELHHLIDPTTGRPAVGSPLRVTVVAESATAAEVAAKVAFLGGTVENPTVVVTADGETLVAGGLS